MNIINNKPIYQTYFGTKPIYTYIGNSTTGGFTDNSAYDGSIDIENLKKLNWNNEHISYFKNSTPHYALEDDMYKVKQENLEIEPITSLTEVKTKYKNNENLEFVPFVAEPVSGVNLFTGCKYIKAVPEINLDGDNVYEMFRECENLITVPELNTENVINGSYMFRDCYNLESVPMFDTSKMTTTRAMFYDCKKLNKLPLFDFSSSTDGAYMFKGCKSLREVPFYNFSNLESTYSMFQQSGIVTIPEFDFSKVTTMYATFYQCYNLESVPEIKTSSVTNFQQLFINCYALKNVALFDTSNANSFVSMFSGCYSLKTIPQFNTSKARFVNYMFQDCVGLTDLPLLDFENVTQINAFFGYYDITSLIRVGGFKNLKIDWNDNTGLVKTPSINYDSIMNIINNLYDFRANGETTTKTIKFNSKSVSKLSDEDIAVATSKGWKITSN